MASCWICVLLYLGTLVAPLCRPSPQYSVWGSEQSPWFCSGKWCPWTNIPGVRQWLVLCDKLAFPRLASVGLKTLQGGKKKITWFAFFNSEIQKEATSLPPKNWKFHLNWCWVFIDFLCVLPLNIGTVVRLVFSFCVFFTKTEFGEWCLITGIKAYFVWPITYPWNRHDKVWSPSPPTKGRPLWRLHTSACRTPAQVPGYLLAPRGSISFHSTPVLSPPSPDTFPFEVVMLGITGFALPLPFPEGPSSLRVQHLPYNVKKHNLPSPPMWFPYKVVTAWSELRP